MDNEGKHERRCSPSVDVSSFAVCRRCLAKDRFALTPPTLVEIEDTQCEPCKCDCGRVVRPLRDRASVAVIPAGQAAGIERHEAEPKAAQASGLSKRVVAALSNVQLEETVEHHTLLIEKVVHPGHEMANGGDFFCERGIHVTLDRHPCASQQPPEKVSGQIFQDGATNAPAGGGIA